MFCAQFACNDEASSISSRSNSKQQIDAMFDDRIFLPETNGQQIPITTQRTHRKINNETVMVNDIEKKKEKTYEDVTISDGQSDANPSIWSILETLDSSQNQEFVVAYLGSKPLQKKNANLLHLQDPLKEIYFNSKQTLKKDQIRILEITKEGLKITTNEKNELHPFSTIAVWTSVKPAFRIASKKIECAFVPLVTEPESDNTNSLFKELSHKDKHAFMNFMRADMFNDQPPIFAVVMTNSSDNKQLECHGFICHSEEEAILVAANLYQELVKKLRRKRAMRVVEKGEPTKTRVGYNPTETKDCDNDPVACSSKKSFLLKSSERIYPAEGSSSIDRFALLKTLGSKNEFESRINDHTISAKEKSQAIENNDLFTETSDTLRSVVERKRSSHTTSDSRDGVTFKDRDRDGDILTRVTIPRSQSFLNANGPLSRFSRGHKTDSKHEITSPLGFRELFNEFQLDEGLENMNDILNVIIDAEGMSFNNLRPIYKEFLLKLALALTKDELYQRSKIIMRRQKRKNRICYFKKNLLVPCLGLNKTFIQNSERLKKRKKFSFTNLKFSSIIIQSFSKHFSHKLSNLDKNKTQAFRIVQEQNSHPKLTKALFRKHKTMIAKRNDNFQPKILLGDNAFNKSSKDYFYRRKFDDNNEKCLCSQINKCHFTTCSECGVSGFSLKAFQISKPNFDKAALMSENFLEDSFISCSCNTESCMYSRKCYCTLNENKNNQKETRQLPNVENLIKLRKNHGQNEELNKSLSHKTDENTNCRQPLANHISSQELNCSDSMPLCDTLLLTTSSKTYEINGGKKKLPFVRKMDFLQKPKNAQDLKDKVTTYFKNDYDPDDQRPGTEKNLFRSNQQDFIRKDQHSWYSDRGFEKFSKSNNLISTSSLSCIKRRFNSMKCRNQLKTDLNQRTVDRRKYSFLSSLIFKQNCNSQLNHIKSPNTCINSCQRFTKRMDVYNFFSEKNVYNRQQVRNYKKK